MVDKIRKIFSKKEDENGHPVGYAEDAVSKLHIDNMPTAVQRVDSWLRQHVPMKGTDEDCLYCKLISCSVLGGVTVYILRQAPKTMRTYQNRRSKIVYGTLVSGVLTCKYLCFLLLICCCCFLFCCCCFLFVCCCCFFFKILLTLSYSYFPCINVGLSY